MPGPLSEDDLGGGQVRLRHARRLRSAGLFIISWGAVPRSARRLVFVPVLDGVEHRVHDFVLGDRVHHLAVLKEVRATPAQRDPEVGPFGLPRPSWAVP